MSDGTTTRADYSFDAMGRVARVVEAPVSASQVRRHLVTDDFEWNETAQRARIHVRLEGQIIATREVAGWVAPASGGGEHSADGVKWTPIFGPGHKVEN